MGTVLPLDPGMIRTGGSVMGVQAKSDRITMYDAFLSICLPLVPVELANTSLPLRRVPGTTQVNASKWPAGQLVGALPVPKVE